MNLFPSIIIPSSFSDSSFAFLIPYSDNLCARIPEDLNPEDLFELIENTIPKGSLKFNVNNDNEVNECTDDIKPLPEFHGPLGRIDHEIDKKIRERQGLRSLR